MYRKILNSVGLTYVWLENSVNNADWLCKEVEKRLQFQFVQKWNSDVYSSSKCINYRIFKTEFALEKYITECQPNVYIPFARIRTTNNRLPIEKGRWENIVRSNRYCTLCNLNLLGDEYHYILECTYFTEKRKLYLPKYYLKHVNVFKFQKLMSTKNTKQLVQLGRFVSDILKKF